MRIACSAVIAAAVVTVAALFATTGARAAGEVHGASDAFAAQGVAIAWAVRRGAAEESTFIVVRIAAEGGRFARVGVDGIDPFTNSRKPLVAAQPLSGETDIRLPRAQFAEYPRTEFRFFDAAAPADAAPALVVYYAGVPDTTPEFNSDSAVTAYLADRLARLRSSAGGASDKR